MPSVASLTITDECLGNPVQFARIIVYEKAEYDAAVYTELGVTETDADGEWLTPICLGGWAAGLQMYVVAYRRQGYRVFADGTRRYMKESGPYTTTIQWPNADILDSSSAKITDESGSSIWANVALGTHPMSSLDESGIALQDESGNMIRTLAGIGA